MARERRLLDIGGDICNGQANSHTGLPEIHDVKRVAALIQQSGMAQRRG